mgnify:CR=1 FL=1
MTIKDLEPKIVFENFYGITRQPRPSKHEEKIRAYLLDWAEKHGVEAFADETGNVIMRSPATPGYENLKGVILQGHMDMVPQKNADVAHDFENDPIETWVDGDWLKAKGTTLGADNGLGVAMALSVLMSKDVKHGPLELLVTYDEETGMTGASALKSGVLKGEILINLDSEAEGELYVGCAGGLDATARATYKPEDKPADSVCYSLAVKGFKGGHSGMDIILCRANANKIAARVVYALLTQADARLVDMEGGTLRNAIPRECFSTLYIPEKNVETARKVVEKVYGEVKAEYAATDSDCKFVFAPCESSADEKKCVGKDVALNFIRAIIACPDGVERMSDQMPGMVETSNNMAMVKIRDGEFFVCSLIRSSVDTAKYQLALKMESVFALMGAETTFTGGYSGWSPNASSSILNVMKGVYRRMFGNEPKVMAIHAGLECGILSGAYPHLDMISCGPTLMSPHSPDERAYIPSVQKVWDFLKEVLVSIPEK